MAAGKEKYLATGHTLMIKIEGGTAYVDKGRIKRQSENVSEPLLLGGVSCEPDLCDPQQLRRIEREYPENYRLSGAEWIRKQSDRSEQSHPWRIGRRRKP